MALSVREDIITDIQKRAWAVAGIKFVSRNLRLVGGLKDFPAIFLVDLGDRVDSSRGRGTPNYARTWRIATISVIKGTSEEKAPGELDIFQNALRKNLFADSARIGVTHKALLTETSRSQLVFPAAGPGVVAQSIEYDVNYIEDTSQL